MQYCSTVGQQGYEKDDGDDGAFPEWRSGAWITGRFPVLSGVPVLPVCRMTREDASLRLPCYGQSYIGLSGAATKGMPPAARKKQARALSRVCLQVPRQRVAGHQNLAFTGLLQ